MDTTDTSSVRSPRRELQGPRPTPLKVRKDSHKIRKPPVVPPPAGSAAPHQAAAHAPPRPPVIIYTVSPKVIHADPNDFMSLVQRLTGSNSSAGTASAAPAPAYAVPDNIGNGGAVSPAARLASIEKTKSPGGWRGQFPDQTAGAPAAGGGLESIGLLFPDHTIQRTGSFPGILSPNPNALPPIPPDFFSPPSLDHINNNYTTAAAAGNPSIFFHDLSPVLHSNRNYFENTNFLLPSPSNNFISPHINTPSPNTLDLFHSLFDL